MIAPEFEFAAVLIAIVPAAIIIAIVYTWRWRYRRNLRDRAQSWPAADATVITSYELDENAGVFSRNVFSGGDENATYYPLWATAIRYAYYVDNDAYSGTYFLPGATDDGHIAAAVGRTWVGKTIVVRYNPDKPEESVFLEKDGAPGPSRVSRQLADEPQLTTLSLR